MKKNDAGCNWTCLIFFLLLLSPLIVMLVTCDERRYTKTFDLVSDLSLDGLCGKSGCYNVISFVISEGDRTSLIRSLRAGSVIRYHDGQRKVHITIVEATHYFDRRGFKSTGGRWIREDGTLVGNIVYAEIHD